MINATAEYAAVIATLNRPLVPELSTQTIEAIAHTFQLARSADPQLTAQQFIDRLLQYAAIAWLDEYLRLRRSPEPARPMPRSALYR